MNRRKKSSFMSLSLMLMIGVATAQSDRFGADPQPPETPREVLIRNATVWTMEPSGILSATDVLIRDGKIAGVGKGLQATDQALVIDGSGKHVTPGLIDAHSHAAVEGFGVNEGANSVTAEVRIRDVLNPYDRYIYLQLAGGLTAANILHGSANSIGGQNAVIKLRWGVDEPDQLVIDSAPPGIKFALGENPKRSSFPSLPGLPRRYPQTRMGVAATIREAFREAKQYRADWDRYNALSPAQQERQVPPARSLQMEALLEILEGKRLVHSHGYRADEFLMLIRLAEEVGFKIRTFQHVLEGYRVADEIARHGAGGSTFSDWWSYKQEAYEAIPYNAAIMQSRGVLVSLNSDDGNLARRLNVEAAKTIRYGGLSPVEALSLVTINPARQLMIDDRTGSLKTGKDADVVVWNGDPLSIFSSVDYTLVDGRVLFSREHDHQHREALAAKRAELIEQIKNEGKTEAKKEEAEGEEKESEEKETSPESAEGSREGEEDAAEVKLNPSVGAVDYQYSPFTNERPVAIVGATVHPLDAPAIPSGVVVFENGKITAVGGSKTAIPKDAERVDGRGKHLWPGVIQMQTVLGLSEIDSVAGSVDTAEMGDWNADIDALVAVHPASSHYPVTRSGGVTHAMVVPLGGIVAGTAALVRTEGWTWEEMAAVPRHSMAIQWPGAGGGPFAFLFGQQQSLEDRKKAAEEKIKELDQFVENARLFLKARDEAAARGAWYQRDRQFEAMEPVIAGKMPLYVSVNEGWAIRQAVEWASKQGFRLVIVGGEEAWQEAEFLAERQVPVVLTEVIRDPDLRSDQPYDVAYSSAARLAAAGVTVAIAGSETPGGSSNARNVVFFAGFAAAFGMDPEEAHRTVTLNPARILGLDSVLGSITVGKSASLVMTTDDLLEPRSSIEQVWIDGHRSSMSDKHKESYEKYRNRPASGR